MILINTNEALPWKSFHSYSVSRNLFNAGFVFSSCTVSSYKFNFIVNTTSNQSRHNIYQVSKESFHLGLNRPKIC